MFATRNSEVTNNGVQLGLCCWGGVGNFLEELLYLLLDRVGFPAAHRRPA